MITERLQKAINDKITAELWSSNLYLQMAYFFKREGWDGFAHWMELQAVEEREHATKMGDFLVERGGTVKLQMIDVVPEGWGSPLEVFEHTYSHECRVSRMIDGIVTLAIAEKDYAAENFFRTFVDEQEFDRLGVFASSPEEDTPAAIMDEQVEEEATASGIVDKIKKVGETGLFFLDSQLGKR